MSSFAMLLIARMDSGSFKPHTYAPRALANLLFPLSPQVTLKDENPAVTFESTSGNSKWSLLPKTVNPALKVDDTTALKQGFTSLVITNTEIASQITTQTRQAVLTPSALGGALTLNQVGCGRAGFTMAGLQAVGLPALGVASSPPHDKHEL